MIIFIIQKNILPFCYSAYSVPGLALLEHGFTGHEHIRQFDLINMNARLYDPQIARFLSPDNEITNPENPQNYDRYAYCLNNPMKYTDPSGNNPIAIAMFIVSAYSALARAEDAYYQGGTAGAVSSLFYSMAAFAVSSIVGDVLSVFGNYAALTPASSLISGYANSTIFGGKYSAKGDLLSWATSPSTWMQFAQQLSSSTTNEATSNQQENGVETIPEQRQNPTSPNTQNGATVRLKSLQTIRLGQSRFVPSNTISVGAAGEANQLEIFLNVEFDHAIYSEVNFVQTIERFDNTDTEHPILIEQKLDRAGQTVSPFFSNSNMTYMREHMGTRNGFYDAPADCDIFDGVRKNTPNLLWRATLSVVGKQVSSGEWVRVSTLSWGYQTDANHSMTNLGFSRNVTPNEFHNQQLGLLP